MNRKCSKCNKEYSTASAISRVDNSEICPECGSREALKTAVEEGALTALEAEIIMAELEKI